MSGCYGRLNLAGYGPPALRGFRLIGHPLGGDSKVVEMNSRVMPAQDTGTTSPTPCGFSQISVPSRDLAQSKQFFAEVLGGDLALDEPTGVRVEFGGFG